MRRTTYQIFLDKDKEREKLRRENIQKRYREYQHMARLFKACGKLCEGLAEKIIKKI
jgi:hypothetical protein